MNGARCQREDKCEADAARRLDLHMEILRLSTLLTRPMRLHVAEPNDLTVDDVKVMVCLSNHDGLAGIQIADLVGLSAMATSRAVARLEERGWIDKHSAERDRRCRAVSLSDAGRTAWHSMQPAVSRVAEILYGGFAGAELQAMLDGIRTVSANNILGARSGR